MKSTSTLGVLGVLVLAACNGGPLDTGAPDPAIAEPPSFTPDDGPRTRRGSGPPPKFGDTRHLADSPPPISGGTLTYSTVSRVAVAADPDRDRIFVVGLETMAVRGIDVPKHAEPGRSVEDGKGLVHVVLRNTGEILSLDPKTAMEVGRRFVCPTPRGIAYAVTMDALLVACATGDVMKLPATLDQPVATFAHVDQDLRDVVVSKGHIYVSSFRNAAVMEISDTGALLRRPRMLQPGIHDPNFPPRVAWRMIAPLGGPPSQNEPWVVHQLASGEPINIRGGEDQPKAGYGATPIETPQCGTLVGPVVLTALTRPHDYSPFRVTNGFASLPVDVATDGTSITILAAGNGHTPERPQLFTYPIDFSGQTQEQEDIAFAKRPEMRGCPLQVSGSAADVGQLVALTYIAPTRMLLQSREPAQLVLWPDRVIISLSSESREDTGHAVFHSNSGADLACASCHAEGADDSHTWSFVGFGQRRTPSLRGTLEGTAPYHWTGDMTGVAMLVDNVFTGRMGGPSLNDLEKKVLEQWLFAIPPPRLAPAKDPPAVVRGKELFESSAVGCAGCHNGPHMTSSQSVDVGTGGIFQVPSLIGVSARAPYLHNGCAKTLKQRFDPFCTSDQHGKTSQLAATQIDDLVAYLESL